MIDERAIGERFRAVAGTLDERQRRIWAAAEARSHGRGGIAAVARASGIAENTIRKGLRELDAPERLPAGRVRRAGAGRKRRADSDPTLLEDLRRLVDGETRGDPERPLLWTSKSVRELAKALRELGHEVSYRTVARLLHELGYSLQANRKTKEGSQHPDRDAQFRYINDKVAAAITNNRPAISIDTKKKELVGEYANGGRDWRPTGDPVAVNVHDFPDKTLGKAIPYGVYDIAARASSTSGSPRRPPRSRSPRSAAGGSNSAGHATRTPRSCRSPPTAAAATATARACGRPSCKIEHRLWSFIAKNWRGRPLVSHEVIINSIAATTTDTGLEVFAQLDQRDYPQGVEVSEAELAAVNLTRHEFHGEWNYTIKPSTH